MHPSGFKFRSRKRVFAEQSTPRATRSKKSIAQQDASLTPSDICVPPPLQANESHTGELIGNLDDHTQAAVEGLFYFQITWFHSITMSQLWKMFNFLFEVYLVVVPIYLNLFI